MNSDSTAQLSAQITEFHIMKANVVKPFAMYSIEVWAHHMFSRIPNLRFFFHNFYIKELQIVLF